MQAYIGFKLSGLGAKAISVGGINRPEALTPENTPINHEVKRQKQGKQPYT